MPRWAALTLGRVELRSRSAPARAATYLRRALALGIPAGLARDAYTLLVEACVRSGDAAGARAAATAYAARFPDAEPLGAVTVRPDAGP